LATAVSSLDRKLDTAPREGAATRARTPWWREVLVVLWLAWVYDAINNLAPLRLGPALAHGRHILSLEGSLGISPERSLDHWLSVHHAVGLAVSDYYDNAHFIVTLAVLGMLWWRGAARYRPMRNALVAINLLAFVVFWLYPVAPPRMLAGFTDVVASTHAIGSWHTGALASQANQLAAMPSLHIAWAVWSAIGVWLLTRRTLLRALALLYPCLTGFAVLATGNHYVLDILAGALLVALAMGCVAATSRALARARARPLHAAAGG
jgi:membrane-associated phospholipid phosphatase